MICCGNMRNASTPQHHVNFPRRQRPLDPVARPATMHPRGARPRAGARPRPFLAAHVVLAAVAAWVSAPHPAAGDCVETTVSPEPLNAPNSPGPCRTFARLCPPAKRAAVTCRVQHMPRQSAMVLPAAHPRLHMRQELARPTACPCQPPRHRPSQRAWPCRTRSPHVQPMDVAFLVDASYSVERGGHWSRTLEFVRRAVGQVCRGVSWHGRTPAPAA